MAGYKSKKKAAEDKLTEWPKVVVGNHLTVTTHEDGRTELEWDDNALLKEVQAAILTVESNTTGEQTNDKKTRKTRKSK